MSQEEVDVVQILLELGLEHLLQLPSIQDLQDVDEHGNLTIIVDEVGDIEDLKAELLESESVSNLTLKRVVHAARTRLGFVLEDKDLKTYDEVLQNVELSPFHEVLNALRNEGFPAGLLEESDLEELGLDEASTALALNIVAGNFSAGDPQERSCDIRDALHALDMAMYERHFRDIIRQEVTVRNYDEFVTSVKLKRQVFEGVLDAPKIIQYVGETLGQLGLAEISGNDASRCLAECNLSDTYGELFQQHELDGGNSYLLEILDADDFQRIGFRKLHAKKLYNRIRKFLHDEAQTNVPSEKTNEEITFVPHHPSASHNSEHSPPRHTLSKRRVNGNTEGMIHSGLPLQTDRNFQAGSNRVTTKPKNSVITTGRQRDEPLVKPTNKTPLVHVLQQPESMHRVVAAGTKSRSCPPNDGTFKEKEVRRQPMPSGSSGRTRRSIRETTSPGKGYRQPFSDHASDGFNEERHPKVPVTPSPPQKQPGLPKATVEVGRGDGSPESSVQEIIASFEEWKALLSSRRRKSEVQFDNGFRPLLQDHVKAVEDELRRRNALDSNVGNHLKAVAAAITQPTEQTKRSVSDHLRSARLVKKVLMPVDLPRLVELIETGAASAMLIKNQDIVLLIGGTGVGKTTTVLFFGGVELDLTKQDGVEFLAPSSAIPSHLQSFMTSSRHQSTTKTLNAVPVTHRLPDGRQVSVLLCDMPGFNDTEGPETDIANGYVTVKALKECRSVKPLLLLSRLSFGERAILPLEEMTSLLRSFIDKFEENVSTFSFVATRGFKDDTADDIADLFHSLKEDADEAGQLSPASTAFLDAIVSNMENEGMILKASSAPEAMPPQEMLSIITESSSYRINDPGNTFCSFVSPKSMDSLREQFAINNLVIKNALKDEPPGLKLVGLKLMEMFHVQNILEGHRDVKNMYDRAVSDVQDMRRERLHMLQTRLGKVSSVSLSGDEHSFSEGVSRDLMYGKDSLLYLTRLDMSVHEIEANEDLRGQATLCISKTINSLTVLPSEVAKVDWINVLLALKKLSLMEEILFVGEAGFDAESENGFHEHIQKFRIYVGDEVCSKVEHLTNALSQTPSPELSEEILSSLEGLLDISKLLEKLHVDDQMQQYVKGKLDVFQDEIPKRAEYIVGQFVNETNLLLQASPTGDKSDRTFDERMQDLHGCFSYLKVFGGKKQAEILKAAGISPSYFPEQANACLRYMVDKYKDFASWFAAEIQSATETKSHNDTPMEALLLLAERANEADNLFNTFAVELHPFSFSSSSTIERVVVESRNRFQLTFEGFTKQTRRDIDEEAWEEFALNLLHFQRLAIAFRGQAESEFEAVCKGLSLHVDGIAESVSGSAHRLDGGFGSEDFRELLSEQTHARRLVFLMKRLMEQHEGHGARDMVTVESSYSKCKGEVEAFDSILETRFQNLFNNGIAEKLTASSQGLKELFSLLLLAESIVLGSPPSQSKELCHSVETFLEKLKTRYLPQAHSLIQDVRKNAGIVKAFAAKPGLYSVSPIPPPLLGRLEAATDALHATLSDLQACSEVYEYMENMAIPSVSLGSAATRSGPVGDGSENGGFDGTSRSSTGSISSESAETTKAEHRVSLRKEDESGTGQGTTLNSSSCFKLLGLDPSWATLKDVHAAFRLKSLSKHPDKGGSADAFHELQSAYDFLTTQLQPTSPVLKTCHSLLEAPRIKSLSYASSEVKTVISFIREHALKDEVACSITKLDIARTVLRHEQKLDEVLDQSMETTFRALLSEADEKTRALATKIKNTKEQLVLYIETCSFEDFVRCYNENRSAVSDDMRRDLEDLLAESMTTAENDLAASLQKLRDGTSAGHVVLQEMVRGFITLDLLSRIVVPAWSKYHGATTLDNASATLQENWASLVKFFCSQVETIDQKSIVDEFRFEKGERLIVEVEKAVEFLCSELSKETSLNLSDLGNPLDSKRAELSQWIDVVCHRYDGALKLELLEKPSLKELVEKIERCDVDNSENSSSHRYRSSLDAINHGFCKALDVLLNRISQNGASVEEQDISLFHFLKENFSNIVPSELEKDVASKVEQCDENLEKAATEERKALEEQVKEVEANEKYEEQLIRILRPKVDEFDQLLKSYHFIKAKQVAAFLNQVIACGIKHYESLLSQGKADFVLRKLPAAYNEWKWYFAFAKQSAVTWSRFFSTPYADEIWVCQKDVGSFLDNLIRAVHVKLESLKKIEGSEGAAAFLSATREELPFLVACLDPLLSASDEVFKKAYKKSRYPVQMHSRPAWKTLFGSKDILLSQHSSRILERALAVAGDNEKVDKAIEDNNWNTVIKCIESFCVAKSFVEDMDGMSITAVLPSMVGQLDICKKRLLEDSMSPRDKILEAMAAKKDTVCASWHGSPQLETPVKEDKNAHFAQLNSKLQELTDSAIQLAGAVPELSSVGDTCASALRHNLLALKQSIDRSLADFPPSTEETYNSFSMKMDILTTFESNIDDPDLKSEAHGHYVEIEQVLRERLDKNMSTICKDFHHAKDSTISKSREDLAHALVANQKVADRLPFIRSFAQNLNDDALTSVLQMEKGHQHLYGLRIQLKNSGDPVGVKLGSTHKVFEGSNVLDINVKTQKFSIDDVLSQMEEGLDSSAPPHPLSEAAKKNLKNQYVAFDADFKQFIQADFEDFQSMTPEQIEKELPTREGKYVTQAKNASEDNCKDVRVMMCNIFAWWCVSYVEQSMISFKGQGKVEGAVAITEFLRQPHAAQVVALFRLFGMDSHEGPPSPGSEAKTPIKLRNHLAEILTGQGKSVTLAVGAVVLALLGYEVDCACYSEYLTDRDYEEFKPMFESFGVQDRIRYGTFNSLCEQLLDSSGNLRAIAEEYLVTGGFDQSVKPVSKRKRALLIDEVDVFFKEDFHGNVYRPDADVRLDGFLDLVKFAWNLREDGQPCTLDKLKASPHYQTCARIVAQRVDILDELLQTMVSDLVTFESHSYICENGRIGYKEADGSISYEARIRFQTMFAYFKEHQNGNVTELIRDKSVGLVFNCGAFSYAEIPLQFEFVIGVTGTLRTLSDPEKNLLRHKYSIEQGTYIPSVYGKRQLFFAGDSNKDVIIADTEEDWFLSLKNEIIERSGPHGKRAVLVFFQDSATLEKFRTSDKVDKKNRVSWEVMKETTQDIDKPSIIAKAATKGQVTLLTREFGRGTDFYCCDKEVIESDGVHVIQTFVSDHVSEETQIKGRTARQDQKGSFSMVLLSQSLERLLLYDNEIQEMKDQSRLYSRINDKRNELGDYLNSMLVEFEEEIKDDHSSSLEFAQAVRARDVAKIHDFIKQRNMGIRLPAGKNSRTVVALDATGSMYSLIAGAKLAVQKMFARAYEVIEAETGQQGLLQMQFCAYRNYSSDIDAIQSSGWETSAEELIEFVQNISAKGGQGNEAVELALHHALCEHEDKEISQVIVIGDAPPNTVDETRDKRNSSSFSGPEVYFNDMRSKLLDNEVTIHAFYIESGWNKEDDFFAMAGGNDCVCNQISVSGEDVVETLTEVVTERLLYAYGGGGAVGQQLVDAYRAKFCKGYTAG